MNKKILSLLAVGATLGGVLSAPTSTVFASRTNQQKLQESTRVLRKELLIRSLKFLTKL
ncbi:MAG: hypothetical protein N4S00_03185 [Lactobacillus crispatus]|nr:hypothetical protein [Lactobacillus crispatus]